MNNLLFSLATSGKSFVEELWDYFVETYLLGSSNYPNLGLVDNSIISLPIILIGLIIGALCAVVAVGYDSRVIGGFVRSMLMKGAVGRENAVTLYDMELTERSAPGRALRKSAGLRRLIHCVEEEDFYAEQKRLREEYEKKREEDPTLPEFKPAEYTFGEDEHFYIVEDKKITAELKYIKRGAKPWALPIIIVASVIVFFALIIILPYILTLLDQLIGSFKSV